MMEYIQILRHMADGLQYEDLAQKAEAYWLESSDVAALVLLALAHGQLSRLSRMAETLTQIENLKDEECKLDCDAQVDLAACYILNQRFNIAQPMLEQVLAVEPDHALALSRLALCHLAHDDLDRARKGLDRSIACESHRISSYVNLVRLCIRQNDIPAAQKALDTGIAQFQDTYEDMGSAILDALTAVLRRLQLEIWVAGEKFAEAEAWLEEKREELDEDTWTALVIGYGMALSTRDRHDQAGEILREALKHYGENIQVLRQLAVLAQLLGRTMQAVALLQKALRFVDETGHEAVELWLQMSDVCMNNITEQALKAAEDALKIVDALIEDDDLTQATIETLSLRVRLALANVESQNENFDDADKMFRELLDENPYFFGALQGLGQQQMQRGHIDEAIELFERMAEVHPVQGHSALINARKFPDDDKTLEKMEKFARKPGMEGSVRTSLLFQLASAWEKRKDYDKAFALATEANEATKRLLNYDPKTHRNKCARIRHAFSRELFDHRKDCGHRSTVPVFVLGMPRSGTTLVEQILGSHSEIFGAGELGQISGLVLGLERWERHTGSGRHYPECVDDFTPFVADGIAERYLQELREFSADAKHIVDKLPHNFENIGLIKFFFPLAKIISVCRDARDIGISNYFTDYQAKHGGMGFAYDLKSIGEQLADHAFLMRHWDQVFPGEILEINYEDVIEDTEGQARKMLDYIGVDWEEQVLAFNELDRPVKTASVWQVRQPIYKTSKARWERYQDHLGPLIEGTNARIEFDPIEMERLPVPGMLTEGVAQFNDEKCDDAELNFKKLLHHFPEHASANFMLGLVYMQKGHVDEGVELMEKGFEKCRWNRNWRADLIQAYELVGHTEKAEALQVKSGDGDVEDRLEDSNDLLYINPGGIN